MIVTGNRVDGGIAAQMAGIYIALSKASLIANNTVSNRGGNGIYVAGSTTFPSDHNKVIGNICFNNGQGGGGANHQAGIQILSLVAAGDISFTTVEHNTCYDTQGTKTQLYGVRVGNGTDCIIRFNDLRGNGTAGYNGAGTLTGTIEGGNLGVITANADTSALSTANVEIEVNQLKATLRASGVDRSMTVKYLGDNQYQGLSTDTNQASQTDGNSMRQTHMIH